MARTRAGDYDVKRQRLLDEAAALFAEHGFDGTSISALSERCGASKAWIYHYYDSKEAVLFDLLDRHLRDVLATVSAADDPGADPRARLEKLVLALLHVYRESDAKHAVQLNDLGRLPADQQALIKESERAVVDVFARALVAFEPALAARPELVKPMTLSLLGMLNWHHRWWRPDGPVGLEEYAGRVVALAAGGLGAAARD
jgi:AcrR family transcriptional regulator